MRLNTLVTGGAGYIGSHTCKALAEAGYNPIVLDDLIPACRDVDYSCCVRPSEASIGRNVRRYNGISAPSSRADGGAHESGSASFGISTGHCWAVKWGPLVVGDIGDRALVRKTVKRFGIRATVHFAAHAYVGESVKQPRKYFDNNVSKTLALLELLDASVDKFVFSSSCATYGIPRVLPIAEHHRQLPINLYGASKLFLENVLYWHERLYGDPPALIADPQLARSVLGWTCRRSDLLTIVLTAWQWHQKTLLRPSPQRGEHASRAGMKVASAKAAPPSVL